uniref:Acb2/Tad1 hairpin domain-containing protein n=1 Tax=viral metagenome TaxID=1070528 RepID=A0A6M3LR96_9ZZZZ
MEQQELDNRFTYQAPRPGQLEIYTNIRNKAKELAELINNECPESREKALAFTQLEDAVFWASAAIARIRWNY